MLLAPAELPSPGEIPGQLWHRRKRMWPNFLAEGKRARVPLLAAQDQ